MDISSLYGSSALDSTAYTNAANQTASKLQDKLNSSDYSKATDDELMDACKQFESYFLEQMFKEMMKTIPESEDTSSSNSQLMDYYKDEMVQQIASDSTEQNSLGLALKRIRQGLILTCVFQRCLPICEGQLSSMLWEVCPHIRRGWNCGKKRIKKVASRSWCVIIMLCRYSTEM